MRKSILHAAADAARDFAYYRRKEDEGLSAEDLKEAVSSGVVTIAEIVKAFEGDLRGWAALRDGATPTTGETT